MHRSSAEALRTTITAIFRAAGAQDDDAAVVADSLIESEICGHESHGLIRVAEYIRHIRAGMIDPRARPELVQDRATTMLIDGNWGFGQVVAGRATGWLIERTLEHGVAAAAVRRCGHVGRAGAYAEMAAHRGLVAFVFVNGGGAQPRVAPHCGRRAVFGTNPMAAAVPLPGAPPVVMDFSTAAVASGKIRVLRDRGERLPEGWVLDRDGRPTTSPEDYYDGGMLVPAAAHKGYALCLLVELLAGCLTGAGCPGVPDSGYRLGNGVFMQAFDPRGLGDEGQFAALAAALTDTVKETPPAAGCEAVMLPGEPERRRAEALGDGELHIADSTWRSIASVAEEAGVSV